MDYREYPVPAEISHLVECFWSNTLDEDDFKQDYDLIIPDGSTEGIFMLNGNYLREDKQNKSSNLIEKCSLVPPFKKAVRVYQKPGTTCVAVRFKTGALRKLSKSCLGDLDQSVYPLETIMPDFADFTMDLILSNTPISLLVKNMISFFLKKDTEPDNNYILSRFVAEVLESKGAISILDFCNTLQIHKSTLEKSFKNDTGLTPKQYAKLIRFNYLLNHILFSNDSLAEVSADLGFYDQSHMTREFKDIVGLTPTHFLKQKLTIPKLAAMSIINRPSHYD